MRRKQSQPVFFATFPSTGRVYVATESQVYADSAARWWAERWGPSRVVVPALTTRVSKGTPNFKAHQSDQVRVAREVHMDIQMLARCDYLLHGASAVAEAAISLNLRLHWNSTHLEYKSACEPNATCHDAPWRHREYLSKLGAWSPSAIFGEVPTSV